MPADDFSRIFLVHSGRDSWWILILFRDAFIAVWCADDVIMWRSQNALERVAEVISLKSFSLHWIIHNIFGIIHFEYCCTNIATDSTKKCYFVTHSYPIWHFRSSHFSFFTFFVLVCISRKQASARRRNFLSICNSRSRLYSFFLDWRLSSNNRHLHRGKTFHVGEN